jgi:hypothetical protein
MNLSATNEPVNSAGTAVFAVKLGSVAALRSNKLNIQELGTGKKMCLATNAHSLYRSGHFLSMFLRPVN